MSGKEIVGGVLLVTVLVGVVVAMWFFGRGEVLPRVPQDAISPSASPASAPGPAPAGQLDLARCGFSYDLVASPAGGRFREEVFKDFIACRIRLTGPAMLLPSMRAGEGRGRVRVSCRDIQNEATSDVVSVRSIVTNPEHCCAPNTFPSVQMDVAGLGEILTQQNIAGPPVNDHCEAHFEILE